MEKGLIIKSQSTNDELYAIEAPLIEKFKRNGYSKYS